ncbi:MAG: ABC transporter permease [Pseudomonadota bacterium]
MTDMTSTSRDPGVTQAQSASFAGRRSFPGARTIAALMLREMSTTYGRTVGGYIWAIVEPLGAIFLLALGFSLLIRNPPLGSNFILFYASGYLVFHVYQIIALSVSRAIVFSRPLMFYPAVTWLDAVTARFVLNALTAIMVCYITLLIVFLVLETRTVIDMTPLIGATLLSLFLGFGVGVTNCALIGLFPTWQVIWSIITKPLFLASGVLFTYESLPQGAQDILWFNPLMHIVGLFRQGIYPMYQAEYVSVAFVAGVATVLSASGIALMHRFHRDILERG